MVKSYREEVNEYKAARDDEPEDRFVSRRRCRQRRLNHPRNFIVEHRWLPWCDWSRERKWTKWKAYETLEAAETACAKLNKDWHNRVAEYRVVIREVSSGPSGT